MSKETITEKQLQIWILASLAAPIAHMASGMSWPGTLAVVLVAAGIQGLFGKACRIPGGLQMCRRILCGITAGFSLSWMAECWPKQSYLKWVAVILLLLGAIMASKGKKETVYGGIALWWITAFLFGSVLLSSVPEIKPENLLGSTSEKDLTEGISLLTVLLIPGLLSETEEKRQKLPWIRLGTWAILFSVCTQGVLSAGIAQEEKAPFYELSRSVRLYGTFERMEALAWLGLMVGNVLYLSCLLTGLAGDTEGKKRRWFIWLGAAGSLLIGIIGTGRGKEILLAAVLLFGYVIPWIGGSIKGKRKMKKYENNG